MFNPNKFDDGMCSNLIPYSCKKSHASSLICVTAILLTVSAKIAGLNPTYKTESGVKL